MIYTFKTRSKQYTKVEAKTLRQAMVLAKKIIGKEQFDLYLIGTPNAKCIVCDGDIVTESKRRIAYRKYCSKYCSKVALKESVTARAKDFMVQKRGAYAIGKQQCDICNRWYRILGRHKAQAHKDICKK
jgi:hypothetical protein